MGKYWFFILLLAAPTEAIAVDSPITLLCKWDISGSHLSKNFNIDEEKKIANGYPATFSPDMIKISIAEDNGNIEHWEINRLNGDFSENCSPCMSGDKGHSFPVIPMAIVAGKCENAPETKEF